LRPFGSCRPPIHSSATFTAPFSIGSDPDEDDVVRSSVPPKLHGAPGARSATEPDDHVRLHDRLLKLPDALFEQILLVANVDRSLCSGRSAALAERVLEVARLAQADLALCRRLAALLDERAPWTRDLPPGSSQLPVSGEGGDGIASGQVVTGAAEAAPRTPAPSAMPSDATVCTPVSTGAASAELLERPARMKREVAATWKAHPRALARLAARIGCDPDPEILAARLVDLRGSEAAAHLLAVYDEQPATPDGETDRAALQSCSWCCRTSPTGGTRSWRAARAARVSRMSSSCAIAPIRSRRR
jgi:hypothetical protein